MKPSLMINRSPAEQNCAVNMLGRWADGAYSVLAPDKNKVFKKLENNLKCSKIIFRAILKHKSTLEISIFSV